MTAGPSVLGLAQVAWNIPQALLHSSNSNDGGLGKPKKPHPPPLFVAHTLYLLPILAAASAVTLLASYTIRSGIRKYKRRSQASPFSLDDDDEADVIEVAQPPPFMPSQGLWSDLRAHFRSLRVFGSSVVVLDSLRTLCLFVLLGLTIYAAIQAEAPPATDDQPVEALKKKKKKKKSRTPVDYTSLELGELGACVFYLYNFAFSFLLLRLQQSQLRRRLTTHIDVLLLLAFIIFAYRDIWPQFTFYLEMSDLNNAVTWSRIAILGVAGVLVPLLRPRIYVPVDPLNPTPEDEIHPEQTAPLLFYVFYEFMTGLVWRAWKVSSLPYEGLHPLADYDRAQHLYDKHMDTLDPYRRKKAGKKPRHLFWGLLAMFRWEFFMACVMSFFCAVMEIVPALAINHLLQYIQADGKGAKIRPIAWVLSLFVGPTLGSLAINYYIFIMTRCLVRSEALLTQLLFDQALRIRMKDSLADEKETHGTARAPAIQVEDTNAADSPDHTAAGSDDGSPTKPLAPAETKSTGQGIVGKINVLMAQDIEAVIEGRDLALTFVYAPTVLIISMVYLYKILSWSALFGVGAIILTFPIPGLITKWATDIQNVRMKKTDARVDTVTEAVGALRIIKMFGWEDRIKARIAAKREEELLFTWKRRLMDLLNLFVNMFLPVLTMAVTFAAYTLIQKKPLTASSVYASMVIFESLKGVMGLVIFMVGNYITSGVSLNRLNKFLNDSDMIDVYSQGVRATVQTPDQLEAEANGLIRLRNATFAWGEDTGNKNIINFRLRVPDVTFAKGKVNLITGPTGSGKSSFLAALTGELHFEPIDNTSFFHLPREGGVSFAAQESWCMSDSIKDNILFGSPYNEARYRQVLHDCALEPDLKLFDDSDQTEIGERGVTLSGGQKARITLARAIYANTSVVLLDDIFSALDTLTSRFILENLFKGDLVKDRTVVVVTHHIHLAAPIASFMVTLAEGGTVVQAETIDSKTNSVASSSTDVRQLAEKPNEELPTPVEVAKPDSDKTPAKLVKDEEKAEGRISRRALFSFFGNFGGGVYWTIFFLLVIGGQGLAAFQNLWLAHWTDAYTHARRPEDVSPVYWLGMYIVLVLAGLVAGGSAALIYYLGSMKASRAIHARLVDHIFGAYMRFLDSTPVGRIISRFTKDIKSIDQQFNETAYIVADMTVALIIRFITAIAFVPIFSIPAILIAIVGGILGEVYMHSQLSVKREMSNAKSPLFSHFASALTGIVSIRAYGAEEQMRQDARRKADKYTRAATAFYNLNRWVTVRLDMLGGLFACLLGMFIVYGNLSASTSGFALTQGIGFSGSILWWVRLVNEMEVQGNSVERVEDYFDIDQEPASDDSKKPPAAWPTSGEVVLDGLCAKYAEDGPLVLDNVSVRIKSGEKIGIVGRTGSGKSTLTLALLRMIPTTGSVYVDGMRTDEINLHDLRTHITIIPQDPILLSGTLRFNLDPFDDHDDVVLNDALESSGFNQTRKSENGTSTPQRLWLDTQIAAGGSNLSQGQRQLVALARALVRQSKVLILDEATASVDFATDQIIQKSIRSLPDSTTVLTVAHRLATIMDYDRILVLGGGKVLEFDTPEALQSNPDGYFAKLVQAMDGQA